LPNLA
jgi:uncharacterized protein YjbI with pentapeptide repeats